MGRPSDRSIYTLASVVSLVSDFLVLSKLSGRSVGLDCHSTLHHGTTTRIRRLRLGYVRRGLVVGVSFTSASPNTQQTDNETLHLQDSQDLCDMYQPGRDIWGFTCPLMIECLRPVSRVTLIALQCHLYDCSATQIGSRFNAIAHTNASTWTSLARYRTVKALHPLAGSLNSCGRPRPFSRGPWN